MWSVSGSVMSDSLWPHDCSPPGSSVHGILQARILELVVIPFSRGSFRLGGWTQVSCIAGRFFTVWPPGKLFFFFFLSKISGQICAHFFPMGYLSLDEFLGVSYISQICIFLSDKYMAMLILCACIFYSLEGAFWWTEILNINKIQFINFSLWFMCFVLRNLCLP